MISPNTDLALSHVYYNNRAHYFYRREVGMRQGRVIGVFDGSCWGEPCNKYYYAPYHYLELPWGCDKGERCASPLTVCPYCLRSEIETPPKEYEELEHEAFYGKLGTGLDEAFLRLWEKSSLTRYIYKPCGCYDTLDQKIQYWRETRYNIFGRLDDTSFVFDYCLKLEAEKSELERIKLEAPLRSLKRLKNKLGRSELSFFKTVNEASKLAKI